MSLMLAILPNTPWMYFEDSSLESSLASISASSMATLVGTSVDQRISMTALSRGVTARFSPCK